MGIVSYAARTAIREGVRHAGAPPQRPQDAPPRHPGTVAVQEGKVITGPPPKASAKQIDGALLWCYVRRYLANYVAFRTEEELDRATAWVFHACARKRGEMGMGPPIWNASPRFLIKSRKRGSGKSTLLTLIMWLTGSKKAPRITAARFAQTTGQSYETVCIDEARHVFGQGASHLDLQACILDGYTPGSYHRVSRTDLPLFGFVAIAAKESLITEASKAVDGDESSIGDILDRCLSVTLTAADIPPPEVGKRAEAEGAVLCRALIAWTDTYREALEQAAQDLADEDYEVTRQRAEDGEQAASTPRALQIGRPLRAVGRVLDQQVIAEARRRGSDAEPQFEATIQACLGSQSEDIMGELEQLADRWGDAQFTGDDEDEQDGLEEWPGTDSAVPGKEYHWPAEPAPGIQFTAGYTETKPGSKPVAAWLPGTWDKPEDAQRACEEHSGGPLRWEYAGRGTWGATAYESGAEFAYVVSENGE